jgi:hypothetical protein
MTESRQPRKTGSPENKKVEAMNGKDKDKAYEVESAVVQGIAYSKLGTTIYILMSHNPPIFC